MNAQPLHDAKSTGLPHLRKYMVFLISGERFAVPLGQVKEVIGLSKITPLPNVPKYFKGLINLRGKIISIIALGEKLQITSKEAAAKPCIIISEIRDAVVGMIVDQVIEVVGIHDDQIERNLDLANAGCREYVTGIAKIESQALTVLLDIGKVLNIEELVGVQKSSHLGKAA